MQSAPNDLLEGAGMGMRAQLARGEQRACGKDSAHQRKISPLPEQDARVYMDMRTVRSARGRKNVTKGALWIPVDGRPYMKAVSCTFVAPSSEIGRRAMEQRPAGVSVDVRRKQTKLTSPSCEKRIM